MKQRCFKITKTNEISLNVADTKILKASQPFPHQSWLQQKSSTLTKDGASVWFFRHSWLSDVDGKYWLLHIWFLRTTAKRIITNSTNMAESVRWPVCASRHESRAQPECKIIFCMILKLPFPRRKANFSITAPQNRSLDDKLANYNVAPAFFHAQLFIL